MYDVNMSKWIEMYVKKNTTFKDKYGKQQQQTDNSTLKQEYIIK